MSTSEMRVDAPEHEAPLDAYAQALLDETRRYDTQAIETARKIMRGGIGVGIVGLVIGAIGVSAAAYLAVTKKEVQPYLQVVDGSTGEARDVMTKMEETTLSYGEALDIGYLSTYTRAREEYSDPTVEHNYEVVRLYSSPEIWQQYQAWIYPENKESPIYKYRTGVVDIQLRNISFIGKNAAQVRFTRKIRSSAGELAPSYWIATISYRYESRKMTLGARSINPLGMVVEDYRIDEEVIAQAPAAARAPGVSQ